MGRHCPPPGKLDKKPRGEQMTSFLYKMSNPLSLFVLTLLVLTVAAQPNPPVLEDKISYDFIVRTYQSSPGGEFEDLTSGRMWYDSKQHALQWSFINDMAAYKMLFKAQDSHNVNCTMGQWSNGVLSKCGGWPPGECPYTFIPSPSFLQQDGVKFQGYDVAQGQEASMWASAGQNHLGWTTYDSPGWTLWVSVSQPHRMLKMVGLDNGEPGEINFSQDFFYSKTPAQGDFKRAC